MCVYMYVSIQNVTEPSPCLGTLLGSIDTEHIEKVVCVCIYIHIFCVYVCMYVFKM